MGSLAKVSILIWVKLKLGTTESVIKWSNDQMINGKNSNPLKILLGNLLNTCSFRKRIIVHLPASIFPFWNMQTFVIAHLDDLCDDHLHFHLPTKIKEKCACMPSHIPGVFLCQHLSQFGQVTSRLEIDFAGFAKIISPLNSIARFSRDLATCWSTSLLVSTCSRRASGWHTWQVGWYVLRMQHWLKPTCV